MNFNDQLTLLLIGAGIALVSSLLTAVVTALVSFLISERHRKAASNEQGAKQLGKIIALARMYPEKKKDLLNLIQDQQHIERILGKDKDSLNAVFSGIVEAHLEALELPLHRQN